MDTRIKLVPMLAVSLVLMCGGRLALAQVDWTWEENVIQPGPPGSWDEGRHGMGDVVFDGTTYHMYLVAGTGGTTINNSWSVGHWTSADIQGPWDPDPCNPVLEPEPGQWDSWSISNLAVLYDGASFRMWYGAYEGYHGPGHGGLATNADGYCDWDKHAGNPLPGLSPGPPGNWDEGGVIPSAVLFDGSIYRMWFGTGGGDPDPWAARWSIGYATSVDGIAWTRHPEAVLTATAPWEGDKVYSPKVVPMGGGFSMWYSGLDMSASASAIGYAVSPDGIHWGKWPGNPVITPMPGCSAADSAAAIVEGGVVHLWISHCFDDIWYLTSPLEVVFFDDFETGDTNIWSSVVE